VSVCFIAGGAVKALQAAAFTLAWTHSVQKTEWQEDWQVSAGALTLIEARIKSSGAGVDPPADARLIDGWWRWRPEPVARGDVVLAHSGAAGDWRICVEGTCTSLHRIVQIEVAGPVTMRACPAK
jgi:hypothetical protein